MVEHLNVTSLSSSGISVIMLHSQVIATTMEQILFFANGEKKIVVQAKRYERNVGIAAVQEVVGSIAYYKADRAMVVTNSNFTKSARDLAKRNEVELWGRKEMQKKFHIKA